MSRRRKLGLAMVFSALSWLWLWATPVASTWLTEAVETDFPPRLVASLPAADAAVVLGGGMSPPSATRPFPDLNEAADRVWHAARLYHGGKAPLLVLSGSTHPSVSPTSEAQAMQTLLRDLGVPDSAMVLEGASRNTRENASFTADILKTRNVRRVLLVTSAMHMARARAAFEAAGLEVVPAATDHTVSKRRLDVTDWLPDSAALEASGRAFKEVVGQWVALGFKAQ